MSNDELPNPFHTAKRIAGLSVRLNPEDAINIIPTMTREQAEKMLEENSIEIATQMISAGLEAVIRIVARERGQA